MEDGAPYIGAYITELLDLVFVKLVGVFGYTENLLPLPKKNPVLPQSQISTNWFSKVPYGNLSPWGIMEHPGAMLPAFW